ncbi:MAG: hypothetical protein QXS26_02845 [Thermosphaera sp.]
MFTNNLRENVLSFLQKYGEKGHIVLKTALSIAKDPNIDHKLGDFSFKHLVLRLNALGFSYNPVNLVRMLEKEYGIIEKTYSSSNQTWWRFKDVDSVEQALFSSDSSNTFEDPKIRLIAIKYRSLEPEEIYSTLQRLIVKPNLTPADKTKFRALVFNEIEQLVKLVEEMYNYEDFFENEISFIKEIFSLADKISRRIERERAAGSKVTYGMYREDVAKNDYRGHSQ